MAAGGKDRGSREARERTRMYRARLQLHASQTRRRGRDNLIAAIVGGVVILAAIGGQVAYFTAGPGAPEPVVSETPAPTSSSTPATAPEPDPATPDVTPTP